MRITPPVDVEPVCGEVIVEITRTRLAAPRLVSPAEAELLFQERVVEIDCAATARTDDPD